MFLFVGLLYLLLSCPVTLTLSACLSGRRGSIRAEIGCLMLRFLYDGVIDAGIRPSIQDRYALSRSKGRQEKNETGKGKRKKEMRFAFSLLRRLCKEGALRSASLEASLGLQDAAQTALAVGAARAAASALIRVYGIPCALRIQGRNDGCALMICTRCIFSASPGDIMFAAIRAAMNKTHREAAAWKSIPLRA